MTTITNDWRAQLDERQQKEIAFAEIYSRDFLHGTTGHNQLILLAKLAQLLDIAVGTIEPPPLPEPADHMLTFGKHSGKTLGEVYKLESSYVDWLAMNARDMDLRHLAAAMMTAATPAPTEKPDEELPF